jgi:hypothetical protein
MGPLVARRDQLGPGPVRPTAGEPIAGLPGEARGEGLVRCPYFRIDRFHTVGPFDSPYPGCLSL